MTGDRLVVSGGYDGTVRVWALGETGRELGRHDRPVLTVAATSNGLVVSGGAEGAVRLWDPAKPDDPGRELGRHDGSAKALAATSQGQLFIGTELGMTMFQLITESRETPLAP